MRHPIKAIIKKGVHHNKASNSLLLHFQKKKLCIVHEVIASTHNGFKPSIISEWAVNNPVYQAVFVLVALKNW